MVAASHLLTSMCCGSEKRSRTSTTICRRSKASSPEIPTLRRVAVRTRLTFRATVLLGLLAVALNAQFSPWSEARFAEADLRSVSESEIYPKLDRPKNFTLNATVVFARGTAWSESRALRQIRKTAETFRACEIGLGRVWLGRVKIPKPQRVIDVEAVESGSQVPRNVRVLSEHLPAAVDYPVAFLIGRVDGDRSLARSYRSDDPANTRVPYLNTAWIGFEAHWIPRKDELYSPLAHEFAHLLCRCGHETTDQRHLLHSARNFLSSSVLPEHCDRMQQSPLVSPND